MYSLIASCYNLTDNDLCSINLLIISYVNVAAFLTRANIRAA